MSGAATVGYDRYGHYDRTDGVEGRPWRMHGVRAGLPWTSVHKSATAPYQWAAAYRAAPFSVSVEGVSPRDRTAGIVEVQARAPDQIGLAP